MEDFYQQYFEIEKTISRIVKDEPFGDVKKLSKYVFLTMANLYLSFLLTYFKVKVKMKNLFYKTCLSPPLYKCILKLVGTLVCKFPELIQFNITVFTSV